MITSCLYSPISFWKAVLISLFPVSIFLGFHFWAVGDYKWSFGYTTLDSDEMVDRRLSKEFHEELTLLGIEGIYTNMRWIPSEYEGVAKGDFVIREDVYFTDELEQFNEACNRHCSNRQLPKAHIVVSREGVSYRGRIDETLCQDLPKQVCLYRGAVEIINKAVAQVENFNAKYSQWARYR